MCDSFISNVIPWDLLQYPRPVSLNWENSYLCRSQKQVNIPDARQNNQTKPRRHADTKQATSRSGRQQRIWEAFYRLCFFSRTIEPRLPGFNLDSFHFSNSSFQSAEYELILAAAVGCGVVPAEIHQCSREGPAGKVCLGAISISTATQFSVLLTARRTQHSNSHRSHVVVRRKKWLLWS